MGDAEGVPPYPDAEDVVSSEDDAADAAVDSASDSEDGVPEEEVVAAVEPAVVDAPAPTVVHDAYDTCRADTNAPSTTGRVLLTCFTVPNVWLGMSHQRSYRCRRQMLLI